MSDSPRDIVKGRRAGCPTQEELLCATDGVLTPGRQLQVAAHLLVCTACRAEVRDWAEICEAVGDDDAHAAIDDGAEAPSHAAFLERLHAQERALTRTTPQPLRRWMAAAAVLSVVIAGSVLTRSPEIVHADELLGRVAAEEAAWPAGTVQRVRYQLRPTGIGHTDATNRFALIREVGHDVHADAPVSPQIVPPPALASALAQYGFDWRSPLSITPVRRWRAALPRKREDLTSTRDGLVLLRTVASSGVPRVVEVVVRADHHVVRQALVVEGVGRLEIDELSTGGARDKPVGPKAATAGAGALDDPLALAELDARLTLQRTGLDVAGVEVSRLRDEVRVDGTTSSAASRSEALSQLAGTPHVRAVLHLGAGEVPSPVTTPAVGLSRWLDVAVTDRRARQRYVADLERLPSIVRRRVGVMTMLADRYPESDVASMSPSARGKLQTLTARHHAALRADMVKLRLLLAAPFGTSPRRPTLAQAPVDWRRRARQAAPHATEFERLVADVISRADDLRSGARINEKFDALWAATVGADR